MTGNKPFHLLLTGRDLLLLRSLSRCGVADGAQIKQIAKYGATSTMNARLLKLVQSGFLNRFFTGTRAGGQKAIYSLSRKGALVIGFQGRLIQRTPNSLLVGDQFIEHRLAVNSVWIQLEFKTIPISAVEFVRWLSFSSPLSKQTPLIPDGYLELKDPSGTHSMFCEVDRGTESLKVWDKKISYYLQLATTREFEQLLQQVRFRVIVALSSERRLTTVRRAVLKQTDKIFRFTTLEDINREGFFAPIWLKPKGEERQSLL
jgi:hypothetical protein